ncbi:MAG: alpha/beta fold hydrolase [Dehalococcoidia bacterium]
MTQAEHTVESATPEAHTALVGGLSIHYLTWGRPELPAIVLLHGGGQSAFTWQRVAARLADRYFLLAPDARGHGDSGWAPDGVYTMDAYREDLRGLLLQLGLEHIVLVGMSMGGMTALAYAGTYGATLRGLVVVDIAPEIQPEGRDRIIGFMQGRASFASLDEAVEYAYAFNPRRGREALRQTLPQNLRTLPDGRLSWKWDPAFMGAAATEIESRFGLTALWEAAARVPCPALVVHGRESDILSADAGERLAGVLPHGRYVAIEGAGHSVQGDNPHSLSEAIEQFLGPLLTRPVGHPLHGERGAGLTRNSFAQDERGAGL